MLNIVFIIQNVAVLLAIGVKNEGYHKILGAAEGMKEDHESWKLLCTAERMRTQRRPPHDWRQKPWNAREHAGSLPRGQLSVLYGTFLAKCIHRHTKNKEANRRNDAKGHPCERKQKVSSRKGCFCSTTTPRNEAVCRCLESGGKYRRDAHIYGLSNWTLEPNPDQQHHWTRQQGDQTPNKSDWSIPWWPKCFDASLCTTAPCSSVGLGVQALSQHESPVWFGTPAQGWQSVYSQLIMTPTAENGFAKKSWHYP